MNCNISSEYNFECRLRNFSKGQPFASFQWVKKVEFKSLVQLSVIPFFSFQTLSNGWVNKKTGFCAIYRIRFQLLFQRNQILIWFHILGDFDIHTLRCRFSWFLEYLTVSINLYSIVFPLHYSSLSVATASLSKCWVSLCNTRENASARVVLNNVNLALRVIFDYAHDF